MAQLPADRTKLALAQGNQVPSQIALSKRNIDAVTEVYDTVDMLNQKVNDGAAASVLPHADGSVVESKLATDSVSTGKMKDGNVTTQKLADGAVTTPKIADASVTTVKLGDLSVTVAKLADNAVQTRHIAPGSITADKFVPGALQNESQNGLEIVALKAEAASHWVNAKFPPVPMVGAKADGTDETSVLQNIINFAQDNNRPLYLPSGSYKHSATLLVTKRIKLFGDGMGVSKLRYSGTGLALKIQPPNDQSSNTFYDFRDFGIEPVVAGGGTYGIDVVLGATAYFSNFEFYRVYIGDFGSYGLHFNNDVINQDGFFTGTIRRCWITNGINGSYMGDSITISENTITGNNAGILISQVNGAAQLVIRENNITTSGGAIVLVGSTQPVVKNNQLEYLGNYTGAYDAFVTFIDVAFGSIEGNTITPYSTAFPSSIPPTYAIKLDGQSMYNVIGDNSISNKSDKQHIGIGTSSANAIGNIVRKDNTYGFATPEDGRIFNGSVNNAGIPVTLTLQNSWVQYDTADTKPKVKKLEDGLISISGSVKNGVTAQYTVIATLPVGFRPKFDRRFQVTNFNGTAFSSITLVVATTGNITILSTTAANNLIQLDGIQFTQD